MENPAPQLKTAEDVREATLALLRVHILGAGYSYGDARLLADALRRITGNHEDYTEALRYDIKGTSPFSHYAPPSSR